MGTNDLHNLLEFTAIQLAALVHVHLIEYLLAVFASGWATSGRTRVSGKLEVNHEEASVQFLLINLTRAIGVDGFEGPVGKLFEVLGTSPYVALFRLLSICNGRSRNGQNKRYQRSV